MRWISILMFLLVLLPSCRSTRETVMTQESDVVHSRAQTSSSTDTIVMKFPESDSIAMKFPEDEPATVEPNGKKIQVNPSADPSEVTGLELPSQVTSPESMAVMLEEPIELDDEIVERYLGRMSVKQKIGQRFISHIEGSTLSKKTMKLIRDEYIAGIILYPWNIEDVEQVRQLTSEIQQIARENNPPLSLFISVDQEGGRVNAFDFREISRFPPPFYWAQYDDPTFIESAAYIIGREIAELGVNMNFAPVLDVYGLPDRTIIGDRSMGNDPEVIGYFGIYYINGAKKAGIIPVVKHFPGHGNTTTDSHLDLPVVDLEDWELREIDFKPFEMAIDHGADAVMTSHVLYRKLDPDYPATLSSKILKEILREQFGFQGVVISDGIAMGALSKNFDVTETLKRSFRAGVDLILVHSKYDLPDLKKKVYRMYQHGDISEQEIDEGVRRVLKLKLKYGLLPREL